MSLDKYFIIICQSQEHIKKIIMSALIQTFQSPFQV